MNLGIIHETIQPDTGFQGGVADAPVILPSGDWEPYLPQVESQNKFGLETLNCVQYSRLNASEIQAIFYGKPVNFSDRGLGWASGCTHQGNTYSACDYWFRKRGACVESLWPWTEPMTWDEYYVVPPQEIQDAMAKLMDEWVIGQRVFVSPNIEELKIALTKGPIWFCTNDHSMVIYKIDNRLRILDSYPMMGDGKRDWPLEDVSKIVAAYIVPFTPKELVHPPMIQLPPNSLVVVVDGHGERLMNVDGTKLYQDDAGKILLEVIARNAKKGVNDAMFSGPFPIVHVKTSDLLNIPRVTLKGEVVG